MTCTQEWDLPHKTTFPTSQLLLTLLITTDITILEFLIWLWNHCVLTISTCLSHLHSLNKHWWTTSALLDAAALTRRQTWASYGQGIICYNRVCYMPWKEEGQSAIRYVRRARNQTQGWGPARAPGGRESEDDPSLCWGAGSRVSASYLTSLCWHTPTHLNVWVYVTTYTTCALWMLSTSFRLVFYRV